MSVICSGGLICIIPDSREPNEYVIIETVVNQPWIANVELIFFLGPRPAFFFSKDSTCIITRSESLMLGLVLPRLLLNISRMLRKSSFASGGASS